MSWKVEVLNKRERWCSKGPSHGTEEEATAWAESNQQESWMNWRLREFDPFWEPEKRFHKFNSKIEYAWKIEVLHEQIWVTVGSLHDEEWSAIDWAGSNREDWWEDWQVVQTPPDDRIRFDRKWLPEPNSGCWLWMGGKNGEYGSFAYQGITMGAHRVSWILYNGLTDPKLVIRHKCNTPCCVNPDHLITGTQLEAVQNMISQGRSHWSSGESHSEALRGKPHPGARGEGNCNSSLSESDVKRIRFMAADGWRHRLIAETLGTSVHNVRAIVSRKTWKHV